MSTKNTTILVATHLIPYPPARGVERRILNLLKWLNHAGHRVILVTTADSIDKNALAELKKVSYAVHWLKPRFRTRIGNRFPILRRVFWERLKALRGKRAVDESTHFDQDDSAGSVGDLRLKRDLCPDRFIRLVGKLTHKYQPTALIAEYVFLTPCFSKVPPNVLKLVDTIDVFSQKPEQVLSYGINDPYACTKEEERNYLLKADAIIAIQSTEAMLLRSLAPEREVILVGMDFDVTKNSKPILGRPDSIAVIASDNALNVHGLRGFLAECWPQIKDAHPKARLHVVGTVGDLCQSDDQAIRYSKWIPNLKEVYDETRVIVNPTVAGTGLKIKSAEALAHGKPLVAWSNGVEGLDYVGSPPYIECQSWGEFADAVVNLLQSRSEAEKLSARAVTYAAEAFDVVPVYSQLKDLLVERRNSYCSTNLPEENSTLRMAKIGSSSN